MRGHVKKLKCGMEEDYIYGKRYHQNRKQRRYVKSKINRRERKEMRLNLINYNDEFYPNW